MSSTEELLTLTEEESKVKVIIKLEDKNEVEKIAYIFNCKAEVKEVDFNNLYIILLNIDNERFWNNILMLKEMKSLKGLVIHL